MATKKVDNNSTYELTYCTVYNPATPYTIVMKLQDEQCNTMRRTLDQVMSNIQFIRTAPEPNLGVSMSFAYKNEKDEICSIAATGIYFLAHNVPKMEEVAE